MGSHNRNDCALCDGRIALCDAAENEREHAAEHAGQSVCAVSAVQGQQRSDAAGIS